MPAASWTGASSPSDLDHDREDHRPALRLLVQVAGHAVLDLALQETDLADMVTRVLDRGQDSLDRLAHHRVLLVLVDEAAGDDLGAADDIARLLVDRDDDHEHPVVRQRLPVAEDDLADLADREAVDEHVARGHGLTATSRAVGVDL